MKRSFACIAALVLFTAACQAKPPLEPIPAEPLAADSPVPSESTEGLTAELSEVSSWSDGTSYFSQYTLRLENTGSTDADGWTAVISVPEGSELSQVWNAEILEEKNIWTFTPVSWNRVIRPKETREDIGFIVASPKKESCTLLFPAVREHAPPSPASKTPKPSVSPLPPSSGISALSVDGTVLKNETGREVILRGISTHGLSWFGEYVNREAFQTLRDDWNVNCIRLAMYTAESGGYCTDGNREQLLKRIDEGVAYTEELGMYVIIDWHILSDRSPKKYKEEALAFFDLVSKKYRNKKHVLFEICNEPQDSPFAEVIRPYAEEVISVIRANGSSAVVLVGCDQWSQKIEEVKGNELADPNVMYTFHFYAATHKEGFRNRLGQAVKDGIPVLISECSICDASGNGAIDYASAEAWRNLLEEYKIGMVGWNLSNKNETSAMIRPDCRKTGGWSEDELSDTGKWFRNTYRNSGH